MSHSNAICFFDFDGTITTKDSLADFIQFAVGKRMYYLGLLALTPVLTSYVFRLTPNYVAKEKLIKHFFKNWDANEFQTVAEKYSVTQIDKITRPEALKRIKWHQQNKHKVVIVSASISDWLSKWCEMQGIELIATHVEIKNNRLSGCFATKNCHGIEKVNRIMQQYRLEDYEYIYAYGDSSGDRPMLALADEVHYKPFR